MRTSSEYSTVETSPDKHLYVCSATLTGETTSVSTTSMLVATGPGPRKCLAPMNRENGGRRRTLATKSLSRFPNRLHCRREPFRHDVIMRQLAFRRVWHPGLSFAKERLVMGLKRAVLLAACGFGTTFVAVAPAGTAVAGPTSATSRTITVTLTDNGHHYRLQTGDHLDVQLSGPSYAIWNEPTSSNGAVLERTGGSSGAVATGTFLAGKKGVAKVTATPYLVCPSVCAGPSLPVFNVSVTVVG